MGTFTRAFLVQYDNGGLCAEELTLETLLVTTSQEHASTVTRELTEWIEARRRGMPPAPSRGLSDDEYIARHEAQHAYLEQLTPPPPHAEIPAIVVATREAVASGRGRIYWAPIPLLTSIP